MNALQNVVRTFRSARRAGLKACTTSDFARRWDSYVVSAFPPSLCFGAARRSAKRGGGRRTVTAIVLCSTALTASACGSESETPTSTSTPAATTAADRRTLRPVSLPDLSRAGESVGKQLRDGYASLMATTQKPGTSDLELGNAYGEMGRLLMAAEYREAAEQCFLNAQALAPADARWPYLLALLYNDLGDAAKSVASFERAFQLQPDDLPTLVWLGSAYLDQGRAAQAEPLFIKALSLQPRSVPALFGLGRTALAKQEYSRAADHLEQALSLDPKARVIHYPLAMAYRGMGNVERAEAHLRQRGPGEILPPDPLRAQLDGLLESAVAYEVRGAHALDQGEWAAAADYFRKGIELAPTEPSLRHKLGTALAMTGDTQGATQQFEEVTRRWPAFAKAQYSYGVVLAASGRHRDAIAHFMAAVKSEPAYVEAHLQWAEALRNSGRFEESLPRYEQAMRLDPRVAEARLGYAMALAGLERYDEARAQLTEGRTLYPTRPEFADTLARLPLEARSK
jgi:tetratricopeptide (TPR) repeat protein